ncbi:MAG: class I SAM-dependent methyltransferase [Cytophagaceae bacterium]|nr:MAG: class I SAM-dependent methyltransferase [Cytophagaceae bacterium]
MSKENQFTLPPPYNQSERHPVFPDVSHDEAARFNFLTSLNKYVSSVTQPGIRVAFERRVRPLFTAQKGRDFTTQDELKSAMLPEPCFQLWGALYRTTIEMRQQTSRSLVLKQLDKLASNTSQYTNQRPDTLHLDPTVAIPTYLTVTDNHAMPGGYYTEYRPDDVSSAATYDLGHIVKHADAEGPLSDGMGRAVVAWLKQNYPDFAPTRILDLGCGPGNNTLPLAIGYPAAQVTGIDVSAPMLRYSHARSVALNVPNVDFAQINAEKLPYDDESVDWVQTTSFLHETSKAALEQIIREIHRVLKPGGTLLLTTVNRLFSLTRNPWHVREYTADELKKLMLRYFPKVDTQGIHGNGKVMTYYEQNKKSVEKITRYDVLNLQHRLPRWMLQVPYDLLNRLNRNKLLEQDGLAAEIQYTDYVLTNTPAGSLDFFYLARK